MANRKLGRRTDHRLALINNQVQSLFEYGRIKTTVTRAKETQIVAEKLITVARKGDLHSRRKAAKYLTKPSVLQKLFDEIGPEYKDRNGGYTRVLKLGPRTGDSSEMAILELV